MAEEAAREALVCWSSWEKKTGRTGLYLIYPCQLTLRNKQNDNPSVPPKSFHLTKSNPWEKHQSLPTFQDKNCHSIWAYLIFQTQSFTRHHLFMSPRFLLQDKIFLSGSQNSANHHLLFSKKKKIWILPSSLFPICLYWKEDFKPLNCTGLLAITQWTDILLMINVYVPSTV